MTAEKVYRQAADAIYIELRHLNRPLYIHRNYLREIVFIRFPNFPKATTDSVINTMILRGMLVGVGMGWYHNVGRDNMLGVVWTELAE